MDRRKSEPETMGRGWRKGNGLNRYGFRSGGERNQQRRDWLYESWKINGLLEYTHIYCIILYYLLYYIILFYLLNNNNNNISAFFILLLNFD